MPHRKPMVPFFGALSSGAGKTQRNPGYIRYVPNARARGNWKGRGPAGRTWARQTNLKTPSDLFALALKRRPLPLTKFARSLLKLLLAWTLRTDPFMGALVNHHRETGNVPRTAGSLSGRASTPAGPPRPGQFSRSSWWDFGPAQDRTASAHSAREVSPPFGLLGAGPEKCSVFTRGQ